LTYLPFFVKAAVAALKDVPIVNSSLNDETGEISLHDRYHIGIATATPAGLLVPVIRDADRKDLARSPGRSNDSAPKPGRAGHDWRTCAAHVSRSRRSAASAACWQRRSSTIRRCDSGHRSGREAAGVRRRRQHQGRGDDLPVAVIRPSSGGRGRRAVFGNALIRQLQTPARLLLPERLV